MPPLSNIVGCDAPQLVERLVAANPNIAAIVLFRPKPFPPLQEVAGLSRSEYAIIEAGLKLRDQVGLSFWDSILLFLSTDSASAENVLKHATRHNPQNLDDIVLQREQCTESNFRDLIRGLSNGQVLAISSLVQTLNGASQHIPMLDFHCRESKTNLDVVKTIVRELALTGFVAKSGGSYHFYGSNLVDTEMLVSILGKALLFSPIVDHRWIAHQLIERACGLRISPGKEYLFCPQIVAEI